MKKNTLLFAMLCLFFISIGTTFASDVNDNKNVNFNNGSFTNTINGGLLTDDANNQINNQNNVQIDNQVSNQATNQNNGQIDNQATNQNTNKSISQNTSNKTDTSTVNNASTKNTDSNKNTNSNKNLAAGGDTKPTVLSQSQILLSSYLLHNYIEKYNRLPNYVVVAGYNFSVPEFMYLMSKTIGYKKNNINSTVTIKYNVQNPTKPTGTTINARMVSKYYYMYANNIVNYIEKYNRIPNYASTLWGKMQYQTAVFGLSKLLWWSRLHSSKMSTSLILSVSASSAINKIIPKYPSSSSSGDSSKSKIPYSILNDKYNGESLTKYLTDSKNCQVSSSTIKSLSNSITKNCNTALEKATAIFNWVNKYIDYSYYYNTKKGALKTLSSRSGNCVDQTHLLIALMRSSGIAAKYVHGKATFSSSGRIGHVWAQVLIDDTWVVADTTSSSNSLGVVKNWNPATATINGKYSSLSF